MNGETDTTVVGKSESAIFGVSVRGTVALLLVATVCAINLFAAWTNFKSGEAVIIVDPLYSGFLVALGYLFGKLDTPRKP